MTCCYKEAVSQIQDYGNENYREEKAPKEGNLLERGKGDALTCGYTHILSLFWAFHEPGICFSLVSHLVKGDTQACS